jgi:hypothetical protein
MAKGTKTGGRTKGTPNRTTAQIRDIFTALVSNNVEQVNNDLQSLEPLERIKVFIELSKFVLPTLKAQDINLDTEPVREIKITREIIDRRHTDNTTEGK